MAVSLITHWSSGRQKSLVFRPLDELSCSSTTLYERFLKHCTLPNKVLVTIWHALQNILGGKKVHSCYSGMLSLKLTVLNHRSSVLSKYSISKLRKEKYLSLRSWNVLIRSSPNRWRKFGIFSSAKKKPNTFAPRSFNTSPFLPES